MTIKVLEKTEGCFPQEFEIGDWYDLSTAEDIVLKAPHAKMLHKHKNGEVVDRIRDVVFDTTLIPLGVAIEVPKGYEAHLLPRSGTFKKWGIIQTNSKGIIDRSFMGDNDEWKLPVLATRAITIPKGTRIAQFRITLSQKATSIQKIKWLLNNKPKLIKVECLGNKDRKGIGEGTGDK
jgi:dUTP pyrophosphatase